MAISVVMATYNGELFIESQVTSILCQLEELDEMVIVDDASSDRTVECIKAFCDPRIKLIVLKENRGIRASFELAIQHAAGEVIFLSDQDDIWEPSKISVVLDAFRLHPDASIVVSDAVLVDESGLPLAPSYYRSRGRFTERVLPNLFRCKFLGCTMAFRADVMRKALPFPSSRLILHDVWIGIANRISGGHAIYIEKPLVLYRRHSANATGNRRLSPFHRVALRADLCCAAARLWVREHLCAGSGS